MGNRQMRDALTNTISVYAKRAPVNGRTVLDKLESCRWVKPPTWEMPQQTSESQGIHFLFINLGVFHQEVSVREVKSSSQGTSLSQLLENCLFWHLAASWTVMRWLQLPTKCVQRTISSRKSLLLDLEQNLLNLEHLLQIPRSGLILRIIHRLSHVGFPRIYPEFQPIDILLGRLNYLSDRKRDN